MINTVNIYIYGITKNENPSDKIAFGCCMQNFIHGAILKTDSLVLGQKVTQYQATMHAALMAAHLIKNSGWDIVFHTNMQSIVKNINKGANDLKYVAHNELFKSMFAVLLGKYNTLTARHTSLSDYTMAKLREKVIFEGLNDDSH